MPATIGSVLRDAAARLAESGSETPRLDAELLLGHVLRVDRATLLAAPEAAVSEAQAGAFDALVTRRGSGEPVAYIRGLKEFYGLVFTVDPRALIPRPETETLVDVALDRIARMLTAAPRVAGSKLRVRDVGTGSGAIVVALAAEARRRGYLPDVAFTASDVSADALALATENAVVHGVADAIDFSVADLAEGASDAVDLLVANLPYIPTAVVPTLPPAASFEPTSALDGGEDGLRWIARLLRQLPAVLAADGCALLEIGADQAEEVARVVDELDGGWWVVTHPDLAGRPRVVEVAREGVAWHA